MHILKLAVLYIGLAQILFCSRLLITRPEIQMSAYANFGNNPGTWHVSVRIASIYCFFLIGAYNSSPRNNTLIAWFPNVTQCLPYHAGYVRIVNDWIEIMMYHLLTEPTSPQTSTLCPHFHILKWERTKRYHAVLRGRSKELYGTVMKNAFA